MTRKEQLLEDIKAWCDDLPVGDLAIDQQRICEAQEYFEDLQDQLAAEQVKVKELEGIAHKQQTIMLQAHDEIEKYWDAHTDPTGYGPNTLMNNLQKKRVSDCYPSRCPFVSLSLDRDKVTHEQLSSLANVLWEKFYKDVSPDFELFDRTDLAVSQVDNMVAGIVSKLQRAEKVVEAAKEVMGCVGFHWENQIVKDLQKALAEYERESE